MVDEPDDQAEKGAENEASNNREIEGGVFTSMDDVTGQAAEAEGEFAAKIEECADKNENSSEKEKNAAKIAEVHGDATTRIASS